MGGTAGKRIVEEARRLFWRALRLFLRSPFIRHTMPFVLQAAVRLDGSRARRLELYVALLAFSGAGRQVRSVLDRYAGRDSGGAELWCKAANRFRERNRTGDAIEFYHRALALDPDHGAANFGLGERLFRTGEHSRAKLHFLKALPRVPNKQDTANLLMSSETLNPSVTCASLLELAREMSSHFPRQGRAGRPQGRDSVPAAKRGEGRLRIGFHGSAFESHGVNMFILSRLRRMDKGAFEIKLYGRSIPRSVINEFSCQPTDGWSDDRFVSSIRKDRLDVLVDLDGPIPGQRLGAFAGRITPVQVCCFNYPATSGLAAIDYFLADEYLIPCELDRFYTEKVYRLKTPFYGFEFPNDWPRVRISPCAGNGFIKFGCFSNPVKLNMPVLKLWAQILNEVKGSKLLLAHNDYNAPQHRRCFVQKILRAGLKTEQVVFRRGLSHEGLLRQHGEVDIILDPIPYSGGHTVMEAQCLGAPLVSFAGEHFVGRTGFASLAWAGMDEFIVRTTKEYVSKNIDLASDPERLNRLRVELPGRTKASPLCDVDKAAADWGDAFREMSLRQ